MPSLGIEVAQLGRTCACLVATLPRLVRPRRPDERFLSSLRPREAPPARGGVTLEALPQNGFRSPTPFIVEGRFSPLRSPMFMGAFLVRHPEATFLVDAGISIDVRRTHLRELPAVTRRVVQGSPPRESLATATARRGVDPASLGFALLTHIHWDHSSGLADLPGVPVRLTAADAAVLERPRPLLVRHGVTPTAYDGVHVDTYELDGPPVETFSRSHDVFGDGTVLVVDLPGHTPGHVGVLLTLASDRRVLLAGDAVWNAAQARLVRQKAPLPGAMVDFDRDEAYRSVMRLHRLDPSVTLLPAHDRGAVDAAFGSTGRLD